MHAAAISRFISFRARSVPIRLALPSRSSSLIQTVTRWSSRAPLSI